MLFTSTLYIFAFVPFVFTVYFFLTHFSFFRPARAFLLFSSLVFYAKWDPRFVGLLALSIGFNYLWSGIIQKKCQKNWPFYVALGANLILLFYFKYFNFFMENILAVTGKSFTPWQIILPLGISFFTFEQIAYLQECRSPQFKRASLIDYSLYVCFFPHLVAGPIVFPQDFFPQLLKKESYKINFKNAFEGMGLFCLGLGKKVLIADTIGKYVDIVFNQYSNIHGVDVYLGAFLYMYQLYFDFSGYSQMAMGVAKMFNIDFPLNFNGPLRAKNIQEFWDRWHISMTRWFGRYLFFPISRFLLKRKWPQAGNITYLITFILIGFWHGANWNFLLFGLLQGCAFVLLNFWRKRGGQLPKALGILITQLYLGFCFFIFRAESLTQVGLMLKAMIHPQGESDLLIVQTLRSFSFQDHEHFLFFLMSVNLALYFISLAPLFAKREKLRVRSTFLFTGLGLFLFFMVNVYLLSSGRPFLYFQF